MSTTTQIFLDTQGTEEGVRDIKVRKHFQFHHLVGDVQKGLGIHIFQFSGFFYALNTSINYKTMFVHTRLAFASNLTNTGYRNPANWAIFSMNCTRVKTGRKIEKTMQENF